MRKFLPYILIVALLAGFFSPAGKVYAIACTGFDKNNVPIPYTCVPVYCTGVDSAGAPTPSGCLNPPTTSTAASQISQGTCSIAPITDQPTCVSSGGTWTGPSSSSPPTGNALYDNLPACINLTHFDVGGCLVNVAYYIFYGLPSLLLTVTARFFDIIIALALSSKVYGTFILKAWTVVRDLANLFFILILLYVAVKIILDIGSHDAKKIIASVIIMALLINFSMFMTEVVIDVSNVLALVFYNKIAVTVVKNGTTQNINYVPTLNPIQTGVQDKDIAGALVNRFDPSRLLTQDFFDKVKKTTYEFSTVGFGAYVAGGALAGNLIPIPGVGAGIGAVAGGISYLAGYFMGTPSVPIPLMLGIIVISGLTMAFAAYAFFIAGFSFLSRLIELWVLIIASPWAFMSSSVPLLSKVEYVGWDSWIKRLLKLSFMAPIFLFILYLIVKIIEADPIGSLADRNYAQQGWMEAMLLLIIPAIIILVLLMRATKFAREGSGALGEAVLKGAKMVGGLALGAATGGAAVLGSSVIGGQIASRIASSTKLRDAEKAGGPKGFVARMALRSADYGTKASFDLRRAPGVGALAKAGGINLESSTLKSIGLGPREGGYEKARADKVKKRQERAKQLEVREDEKLKQELNKMEGDLQELLSENAREIEFLDKDIEKKRVEAIDAERNLKAASTPAEVAAAKTALTLANIKLKDAKDNKKDFREGRDYFSSNGSIKNVGRNIEDLEEQKKDKAQEIKTENILRKQAYANSFIFPTRINKEAANKIRTEAKLDSGTKT